MNGVIVPIVGMLIPIVIVPVVLGLKHARFERQLEHEERMKALELGRTLPEDESWWTPPRLCAGIGIGVPIVVMGMAFSTTQSIGFRDEVWGMSVGVSTMAVICGALLTAKHFNQRAAEAARLASQDYPKATYDADAFDVVSRRG